MEHSHFGESETHLNNAKICSEQGRDTWCTRMYLNSQLLAKRDTWRHIMNQVSRIHLFLIIFLTQHKTQIVALNFKVL